MGETLSKWVKFYKSLRVVDDSKDEIVKGVVEVILGGDWSEEVESKLNNLKLPSSCDFLFRVIWKLWDEPLKRLEFFEWVASYLRYEHNSITYGEMARVLAQHKLMDEFWDLMIRMRTEGCDIDIETYVKITRRVGNIGAVKLFEYMMDGPYKLSEQECVWLLKILAHENEPDMNLVMRVINKYLEVGNSYNEGMYIGIHRVMCKLGRFDEAKKIMEGMKKAGHETDIITYSQEIFGLCRYSRFEDARLVFNQMETEGCIPNIKTWTVLIQGYFSAGEVELALSCFVEMLQKNIAPDVDILEVLINGFLNHNKLLGEYKILVEMAYKARLKPFASNLQPYDQDAPERWKTRRSTQPFEYDDTGELPFLY